ncbi:sulfatase-like hydrolase/transferase [Endozoicomonas elysicola]|uniref:Arylsulfatase n=1 Tax=Endozoicomonas elysicola TaxID=305900 RepID=A0A081KER0_9GAMM|nr:sulfatase-like hydrolase/transferase [Endozoicomonas elysicola]KEI72636.1 arylsulfatase [Endozoicomonas elysicola]
MNNNSETQPLPGHSNNKRRYFSNAHHLIAGAIIALTALPGMSMAETGQVQPDQPNIIVMMADDLGWADVGINGSTIETPNIDSLAAEGATMERFYVAPTCSPTRAALMTARDPMRLGIAYATVMPWSNNGVNPNETLMPQSFKANGYQTAMFGKWHLGMSQESYVPNQRGFDYFYGHLNTEVDYFPPYKNQGGADLQRNGVSVAEETEGYATYLLADDTSRWIRERDKTKPFFAYVPFLAPHTPLQAPAELIEKYKDLNDDTESSRTGTESMRKLARLTNSEARPIYAAMVDAMDQAIGRILNTLDEENIADNTIVMFFSDNGGPVYGGAGAYNYPLRGGKGNTFEGGIRVPSVARWPEQIPAGTKVDSIMTVMDVFPTMASAAGFTPETTYRLDGHDMLEAMTGKQKIARDDYVFFVSETPVRNHFSITAFNDQWKLVQKIDQSLTSIDVTNYLFDINADPYEHNNLAANNPKQVAKMAEAIREWRLLHPLNGTRSNVVPPPGWRAPRDWADYPIPMERLQAEEARGMPPEGVKRLLDRTYGDAGRLIYDCTPNPWLMGFCTRNN